MTDLLESDADASSAVHAAGGHDANLANAALLDRIAVIEAQPLEQRAALFEMAHEELLAQLQRGDQGG